MKRDPAIRDDGRCFVCGVPRKLPKRPVTRDVAMALYEVDPFCSSACCRQYHDAPANEVYLGDPDEKRGRYDRTKVAA